MVVLQRNHPRLDADEQSALRLGVDDAAVDTVLHRQCRARDLRVQYADAERVAYRELRRKCGHPRPGAGAGRGRLQGNGPVG